VFGLEAVVVKCFIKAQLACRRVTAFSVSGGAVSCMRWLSNVHTSSSAYYDLSILSIVLNFGTTVNNDLGICTMGRRRCNIWYYTGNCLRLRKTTKNSSR
jgi:hypothetical protein